MTDTTANLGLPFIAAAQAQKHVTHNAALSILDTLVQLAVLDRDLATPPGSPADGQRWIVAASPTGAWAGHANDIAAWQDGAWQFSTPKLGWIAYLVDEGTLVVWNGSSWSDFFATVTSIQNLALLGVGTTADGDNPFSAKLNTALWTAKTAAESGTGDLRYTMNKEAAANVLSLLMQSGFSGRAEIGLIGDDNLTFKVSPDGSSWTTALVIDKTSGAIAAAGGNWGEPVASWTHSSDVAAVAFTDLGVYRELLIVCLGLTHNSGTSQNLKVQVSSDNGATWLTGGFGRFGLANTSGWPLCLTVASAVSVSGIVEWLDFNAATRRSVVRVSGGQDNSPTAQQVYAGAMTTAAAYNAIQVLPSGGSLTAGSILVYGKR